MFAKLDSSQMASVIAKELKYFTKQGGNIVFDGIYEMKIWNKGKSVVIVIMMKLRLGNGTRIKTEGEGEGKNGNGQDEENEGG